LVRVSRETLARVKKPMSERRLLADSVSAAPRRTGAAAVVTAAGVPTGEPAGTPIVAPDEPVQEKPFSILPALKCAVM
jgi:hypothetical protein